MIQLLVLAANPKNASHLNVKQEIKQIEKSLAESRFRNQFSIRNNDAITISQLQESFLEHEPHVVHFSGHGSNESSLIFEQKNGGAYPVPPKALAELFEIMNSENQQILCVVLNACYSKEQGKAICKHVPCVIGMTEEITDEAAIKFSTGFYRGLSYGQNIKEAYRLGLNELKLERIYETEKIKLLHKKSILPSEIVLVDKHRIPSKILSESKLERDIHILLENPEHKGRDIKTIIKNLNIPKVQAIKALKKIGAYRIVSDRNDKNPNGEYWGIIKHVIRVHYARSKKGKNKQGKKFTAIKKINLIGNFKDKENKSFQKEFDRIFNSMCVQLKNNKSLWRLKKY